MPERNLARLVVGLYFIVILFPGFPSWMRLANAYTYVGTYT